MLASTERPELRELPKRPGLLSERALASQAVDRAVPRGGRDPGSGVVRDPGRGPPPEGDRERLLDGLLRKVEITEDPDQGRDRSSLLLAEQALDDVPRLDPYSSGNSMIGRTSIDPRPTLGILEAASIASSRFEQSIR